MRYLFVLLVIALVGCNQNNPQPNQTYDVEYKFTGGDCWLKYMNDTESYNELQSVVGSWSYTCQKSTNDVVFLQSQNNQGETGVHTVQVFLDGVLYKEATSSGADTYATIQEILE